MNEKVIILGNAGSGKSTLAAQLAESAEQILSLDDVAFVDGTPERRPLSESVTAALRFLRDHEQCIIEGCYADIIAPLLPHCNALVFLNPGVDVCLAHCRQRPWEPGKFESREQQDEQLAFLLEWVGQYETRTDEFGLAQHRAVFDAFAGSKLEVTRPEQYLPTLLACLS